MDTDQELEDAIKSLTRSRTRVFIYAGLIGIGGLMSVGGMLYLMSVLMGL